MIAAEMCVLALQTSRGMCYHGHVNNDELLGIAPGQLWFWNGRAGDPMIVMIIDVSSTSKSNLMRCWNALVFLDVLQRWCLRTFAFDVPQHWTRIA